MSRKILSLIGFFLVMVFMQSCSSDPEKSLLDTYFHADSLGDVATLSAMAISPLSIKADSHEIISVTEEVIEPATLPDLNKKYLDLKKQVDDSTQITIEVMGELDDAKFEEETSRTTAAKRAARTKVNAAQAKYDEQYEKTINIRTERNDADTAAAKEEEITLFSLGALDLITVRDLTGEVAFKEVTVRTVGDEGTKDYKFFLRKYTLKDEATNTSWRGRYKIILIKSLD